MNEFLTPVEGDGQINEDDIWNHLIKFVNKKLEYFNDLDSAHLTKLEETELETAKWMVERLNDKDLDLALKLLDKSPSDLHRKYSQFLRSHYQQKAA